MEIERLQSKHAQAISACFHAVYGDSYANGLFYDVDELAREIREGRLCSVGALAEDDSVIGHMAMVCHPDALFAELGNTVVAPAARGAGVAWQVGAQLTDWCVEKGYRAYLHYPTTDHHIMQRQSVKSGFETGLMLGYIPAETDGKVNSDKPALRGAATVVVNPLGEIVSQRIFLPDEYRELIDQLACDAGIAREIVEPPAARPPAGQTNAKATFMERRGLKRLQISSVGTDLPLVLKEFLDGSAPCQQLDFLMSDAGLAEGVGLARQQGFIFCAWMPGYRSADVLRLQRFDSSKTDLNPGAVNPVGQKLAALCREELGNL